MKKLDAGQLIQITANLAVLAGIVFLALELKQLNIATRLDAVENYTNRANELDRLMLENDRVCEAFFPGIPEDERCQAIVPLYFNQMRLRSWQAAFVQYEAGILDEAFWNGLKNEIAGLLFLDDALVNVWRRNEETFDLRFNEMMEEQYKLGPPFSRSSSTSSGAQD